MNDNNIASVKEIVEYNLDKIPKNEMLQISIKDYIYIRRVLEEFNRYFHNLNHYQSIDDIMNFLGNKDSGDAYEILSTAIYDKLYKVNLPKEIQEMIDNDTFDSPLYPRYYKDE